MQKVGEMQAITIQEIKDKAETIGVPTMMVMATVTTQTTEETTKKRRGLPSWRCFQSI